MIISPLRAFTGTPFTSILTNSSAINCDSLRCGQALGFDDAAAAVIDHVFKFVLEVLEEALHRPRRRIAQGADGMALDAIGDIQQQPQILAASLAGENPFQHAVHPARSLAA